MRKCVFAHIRAHKGNSAKEIFIMAYTEKRIEQIFVSEVKKRGGIAPKWVSPGFDGVPDRLVLFEGGVLAFVELKAPGKKMRALQVRRKRQLEKLGFKVFTVDNPGMIGGILDEIQTA